MSNGGVLTNGELLMLRLRQGDQQGTGSVERMDLEEVDGTGRGGSGEAENGFKVEILGVMAVME